MYATINGKLMYKDEFIADIVVSDQPFYQVSNLQYSKNLPWSLIRHPNGFGLELFIEERMTPRERPSLTESLAKVGVKKYCVPWLLITSNGRCADDCYWIKFPDYGATSWEEVQRLRLPEYDDLVDREAASYINKIRERCGIKY